MKLNDKAVQAATDGKHADGGGLTLLVKESGTKLWWFRYRFSGKEKTLAIGQYPIVTLKDAREAASEARKLLAKGIDPMDAKKAAKKVAIAEVPVETVEMVAREWLDKFSAEWADTHTEKIVGRFRRDLYGQHIKEKHIYCASMSAGR